MKTKLLTVVAFLFVSLTAFAAVNMKQEYRELKAETEKQMRVIDQKMEKLSDKIANMSGEAKQDLQKGYDNLAEMKDDLKDKLEDAADTSEDKWASAKDQIEDLADNIESKIDEAID